MERHLRQVALVIIDMLLVTAALWGSLWLRFDGNIELKYCQAFIRLAPLFAVLCISFFLLFRLYNRFWKYASLNEALAITKASTLAMLSFIAVISFAHMAGLPRSVYTIAWVLANVFVGLSRLTWRIFKQLFGRENRRIGSSDTRVLIIGAGDAGALLLREIHNNQNLHYRVMGFLDDDRNKKGNILGGVPVLGKSDEVDAWANKLGIGEIIIAIPSASGADLRHIVDRCASTSVRVKILPGFYPGAETDLLKSLREVEMEDLLRRKPVEVDLAAISGYITGETVLITGAGGSIGSELCRQILALKPRLMVMLDNCENNLFDIEMELKKVDDESRVIPYLADIRDREKMEQVFAAYHPGVVFHAAAYKHVPMMERYPQEAVRNNVMGSANVAEMADQYGADTFILVSTDKAVNPTSVMGATKRIAELVINDIARTSKTKFAAVRFGNVLGSRGSVIPIFKRQILQGGPLTVTHPEMRRFFMTIPEAVQLIIQAGALARGGEIFVLDMGKMVKIDDLARDLIRLSGYEPDKDIRIVYTGIRPGEKLYEELFTDKEGMGKTQHKRIFISHTAAVEQPDLQAKLTQLLAQTEDAQVIKHNIKNIVPEYTGMDF